MAETRMSVDERLVLRADRDPRLRSTVGTVAVLAGPPDPAAVRDAVDRVSRVVPRLRDRAVLPTLPTTEPRWVTDPDFDLDHHVRRVALPGGADWTDFLALVETLIETPLDPARPQWTFTLVEGLPDGQAAVVTCVSSVIREGGQPLDLLGRIADASGTPGTPKSSASAASPGSHRDHPHRPLPAAPVPTDLDPGDLALAGLKELPMRTLGLALGAGREAIEALVGAADHPTRALGSLLSAVRATGDRVGRATGPSGSVALAGRGVRRRILTLEVPADRAAVLVGGPLGRAHSAALTVALEHYQSKRGLSEVAPLIAVASHPAGVRSALDPTARETVAAMAPYGAFLPAAALDMVRGPVRVSDVAAVTLGDRSSVASVAGVPIVAEYAVGPVPGNALTSVVLLRDGALRIAVRFDPAAVKDELALREALEAGWASVAPPATPAQPARAARPARPARSSARKASSPRAARRRPA